MRVLLLLVKLKLNTMSRCHNVGTYICRSYCMFICLGVDSTLVYKRYMRYLQYA